MPVIDLYGRNPDVEDTLFAYPGGPRNWDKEPDLRGARWFTPPAGSAPVFGSSHPSVPNAEDNVVLLDPNTPTSTRTYGLGAVPQGAVIDEVREAFHQDPTTRLKKKGEARAWFSGATSDMGGFWKRQTGPVQVALGIVGAVVAWNLFKRIGR